PYANRSAVMRAELNAWQRGEEPKAINNEETSSSLTGYEIWQYRAAKLKHDLRQEQKYFEMTKPLPGPSIASPEENIAYIRKCLDRLVASTKRGEGPSTVQVMPKQLQEIIASSEEITKGLESGARPTRMSLDETLRRL